MKYITIALVILIFNLKSYGQSTLEGHIVDVFNKSIANVYVVNTLKNKHTHTSENGNFKLQNVTINDSLFISILGFEKQNIKVTAQHLSKGIQVTLLPKTFQLEELVLNNQMNALKTISKMDLKVNPVNNSQEILRKIPGLFIGQHAGGGKAEQIFLRGFDIDHGTDITLSVDGMPINMVSHAHGQGYSDLHFMIPETLQKIDFGKGPYNANQGDFNTAGYVNFSTKTRLKDNIISLGVGQFNNLRTLGMFNLLESKKNENAYVAVEYIETDGAYESPQNFNRFNLFGKYTSYLNKGDKLAITASHFTSQWDASGQIPERAVKNGSISRFGAIDDTEGGLTSRSNINLQYDKNLTDNSKLKSNIFYSNYNFKLFSNFTFFLEDSNNGDQIMQQENRDVFGANAQIISNKKIANIDTKITQGVGLRYDLINDVELSHTKNRNETLQQIQLGNIRQRNLYAFLKADFDIGKFKISPAARLDYFKFLYQDALATNYKTLSKNKAIINPKLNFLYTQNNNLQWFLKSGIGFHSNDARVILQQKTNQILPKAYGLDIGNIWKPFKKIVLNTALWYLLSEEELVYVGDAGIIEPSGKSKRFGLDFGIRYQALDWLMLDSDATITKARSIANISGQDYIPLAPKFTLAGGLSITKLGNFSGGIRYRYLGDRPANEDNSIVAEGYFVTDMNINYSVNKNINIGVAIENIIDVEWNETQFATESRLQNESNAVEEIHFTPGTPFFVKTTLSYRF